MKENKFDVISLLLKKISELIKLVLNYSNIINKRN